MKKRLIKKISQVILMIFVVLILPESKADEKPESKSFDNSRVKVLYELTFPDCVETYLFGRSKDNVLYIDKVLTSKEVYSVDEKHKTRLIMKRGLLGPAWTPSNEEERKEYEGYRKHVQQHPEVECGLVFNSFSPDGKYLVEAIGCGDECGKTRITDLVTYNSVTPEKITSPGAVSETTFLSTNIFAGTSYIFNYNGTILKSIPCIAQIKSHKNGYVGNGMDSNYYFMDSKGLILKKVYYYDCNFDINYETGTTAIVTPNTLYILDFNGQLKHKFRLPFSSYTLGVGVSSGAKYVAVLSIQGKVCLFDISKEKLLWTRKYKFGNYFDSWTDPIPVSIEGKYTVVLGKLDNPPVNEWSLIIFNKLGNVIGTIDASEKKRGYLGNGKINFIPGTTKLVFALGRKLTVYEIKEAE